MNRRSFLNRAGLLIGGLTLDSAFQMDLKNQLGRLLLPSAGAAENVPRRTIDLCFRSGIPMIIFATGKEFTNLSAPKFSNFSYAGNGIVPATAANNLYFNTDSQSLVKHAANIAITQGVTIEGGHTNFFNYREGGMNKSMAAPIVELADLNTTGAVIHGVQFPGAASNRTAGRRDLTQLTTVSAFSGLFKNPRLRLTGDELSQVLATAQKLSRRQALMLENKLESALAHQESHTKAAQMFNADYSSMLNLSGLPDKIGAGAAMTAYPGVSQALGLTIRGFQNNLINSSMVTIELADWHGYQNDKQEAGIIKSVSDIISATIDALKATPEPNAPGLTLWDTTTIVAGSEFTRGISPFSMDNSDGGTQGAMLIGKNVIGGYYGGFNLPASGYGSAFGFNPVSGVATPGMTNSPEGLYQTIRKMSGLTLSTTDNAKVFSCMLRPAV